MLFRSIEGAFVAGFAFCPEVPPEQRIFRVQSVIEDDRDPVPFRMAGFTLLSVAAFVLVVFLVARVAVRRGVFKCRGCVTFLALGGFMLSD